MTKALVTLPLPATRPAVIPNRGYERMIALDSPVPLSADGIRWVEAWMRLEHSTLDGLSPERFKYEVGIAVDCIAEAGPDDSESLARSFGL